MGLHHDRTQRAGNQSGPQAGKVLLAAGGQQHFRLAGIGLRQTLDLKVVGGLIKRAGKMALDIGDDVRVHLFIRKGGVHLKRADRCGGNRDGGGAPPVLGCSGQQAPNGRTHRLHIADMLSNHSIRRQRRHAIELHPVGVPPHGQLQELDRGAADIHAQQVS